MIDFLGVNLVMVSIFPINLFMKSSSLNSKKE